MCLAWPEREDRSQEHLQIGAWHVGERLLSGICRERSVWAPTVFSHLSRRPRRLEIDVPRGTRIFVGIQACNRNEALWGADADEWKPERWLKPPPTAVESAAIPGVYSNLITFFSCARSCIGFTFSQLEMKVVLSAMLANFTFELSRKPVVWNLTGISYPTVGAESTKKELWLKVKKLHEGQGASANRRT